MLYLRGLGACKFGILRVNLVVILSENEFVIPFPNSLSMVVTLISTASLSLLLQEDMVSATHEDMVSATHDLTYSILKYYS